MRILCNQLGILKIVCLKEDFPDKACQVGWWWCVKAGVGGGHIQIHYIDLFPVSYHLDHFESSLFVDTFIQQIVKTVNNQNILQNV